MASKMVVVFVGYLHSLYVKVDGDVFSRLLLLLLTLLLLTLTTLGIVATGSCSTFRESLASLTSEFSTFLLLGFCLDETSVFTEVDNVFARGTFVVIAFVNRLKPVSNVINRTFATVSTALDSLTNGKMSSVSCTSSVGLLTVLLVTGRTVKQAMAAVTFVMNKVMSLTVTQEIFATVLIASRTMVFVRFTSVTSFILIRALALEAVVVRYEESLDDRHGIVVVIMIVQT